MSMRTNLLIGLGLLVAVLVLGALTAVLHPAGPGFGFWGQGRLGGYGPALARPGLLGRGFGLWATYRGPWYATGTPITSPDQAQTAFQGYLDRLGNPDLALDEVLEFQQHFYVAVKEQSSGGYAFELLADKQTGAVFPEFGPGRLWNTKYGHAPVWAAAVGQTTIPPERARELAQQWLDANQPGSAAEHLDAFPGYDTLRITRNGQITGLLSVNVSTGQVWYHAWLGPIRGGPPSGR